MAKRFLILSCSFALLVFSFEFCLAATWLDPSLKWKTLETPHFSIHYYEEEEQVAKRLAPIAEEVHVRLTRIFKYEPSMKTNVLLLDNVDYGNGSATVIPDPKVTLYLTDWSTSLNPSKFDLWLKFLFTHEYTHILHLDLCEGYPSLFRAIFGRVVFPNALEPWFMVEGLAAYSETKNEQWGRGWDPRWDMMMRMDILENNIKSIDQAAVDSIYWPDGHLRYLYGVKFLEYLSLTYGEDKLISLIHIYGDYLYSWGIDGAFIALYQKKLNMLWKEWLEYERKKYEKQQQSLGPLTIPHLVTHSGYYNLKPKWSKDAKYIFYAQQNADHYPNIRKLDPGSGEEEKILEGSVFADNLSLDPSGRKILFSKSDYHSNFYFYKDLYLCDLEGKKIEQLTSDQRASDADISPDASRIVFVRNKLGTRALYLMKSDGSDLRLLCSYETAVQYFSPRFSPDAKKIAVAKWSPGGEQKIYLVDPETGKQERLTLEENLTSEANPCFSPDGEYVFFDSDQSGIVNLYAFHLKSKRLYQVTNVLGGAMMPDVSPDGKKIAYVSYSSRGYDIAVMDLEPSQWEEISLEPETESLDSLGTSCLGSNKEASRNREVYSQVPSLESHDYNPIPALLPKFWMPLSYINENGSQTSIYTFGLDTLGHHVYYLDFGYDFEASRPQYYFLYANNQFLPQVSFTFADSAVPYSWSSQTLWMREKTGQIAFTWFDYHVFSEWDRQSWAVGFEQTNITNISSIGALSAQPSLGNINGGLVAWSYSSSRKYVKSVSFEDGMDVLLGMTVNSKVLGSDYAYTNYNGSVAVYFAGVYEHQVLTPTLSGFYSRGDQLAQSNYSWKYLSLRGYPSTNLLGNKGVTLSTEYRFPLWRLEKGLYYGSTFFDRVWGSIFYDLGGATLESISSLALKRGYGLEFTLDTELGWGYYGVDFKLGYAKGLDEGGEEKIYFTIEL